MSMTPGQLLFAWPGEAHIRLDSGTGKAKVENSWQAPELSFYGTFFDNPGLPGNIGLKSTGLKATTRYASGSSSRQADSFSLEINGGRTGPDRGSIGAAMKLQGYSSIARTSAQAGGAVNQLAFQSLEISAGIGGGKSLGLQEVFSEIGRSADFRANGFDHLASSLLAESDMARFSIECIFCRQKSRGSDLAIERLKFAATSQFSEGRGKVRLLLDARNYNDLILAQNMVYNQTRIVNLSVTASVEINNARKALAVVVSEIPSGNFSTLENFIEAASIDNRIEFKDVVVHVDFPHISVDAVGSIIYDPDLPFRTRYDLRASITGVEGALRKAEENVTRYPGLASEVYFLKFAKKFGTPSPDGTIAINFTHDGTGVIKGNGRPIDFSGTLAAGAN